MPMNKTLLRPIIKRPLKKRIAVNMKGGSLLPPFFQKLTFSDYAKFAAAFLLSGTSLIGDTTPLGFSFFAAVFGSFTGYICGLFAILGLIFKSAGLVVVGKYIIASLLFSLIYERFIPEKYRTGNVAALIAAGSVLLSGLFLLFTTMSIGGFPLIYDVVTLIVETATISVAVPAFRIAAPLALSLNMRRSLTTEETVSLSFLAGGIICGLGIIEIGGVFSVSGTLCVLTVLIFACRYGSLHGCSAGIIMGIIYCISRGRIDTSAASFAVSGLCAGYFSNKGRWAACLSFIMANAVITIMTNGSTEVLINLFDTVIAAAILYCIPKNIFETISRMGFFVHPGVELASDRLHGARGILSSCEKSFRHLYKMKSSDIANRLMLYRRSAHKTCSGCGLRKYCWGRDSASTKAAMDTLLQLTENGEVLLPENAPPHCLRRERFIEDFSHMYELYKSDCVWSSKISELQNAVYNSFSGITDLLSAFEESLLTMPDCDAVCADNITAGLRREGINVKNVFVSGSGDDTEIRLTPENCGGFGRCENAIRKVLDNVCGKHFVKLGTRSCGECICRYVVKPSFSISAAVAGAIKTNRKASGDYVLYAMINRYTYAIVLCDGMGSGEIAREESKTCASLLIKLLEAGLKPEQAISMINSMLLCASTGTLTAIDLCLISLEDGSTRLYKCGAAGTFAKTNGDVTLIDSSTLPAGAVLDGDTEIYNIPSTHGSMIVLISDGAVTKENLKASGIGEIISAYESSDPEKLAHMILNHAKSNTKETLHDDITVIAAYIS